MPKFKTSRLVPKLFTGIPVSGATYDLSAYSANTIAPYELSLNTSAQTIVVNFGGQIVSFAPTGGTSYISAVTTNSYVYRTGDTMTGNLTMSGGSSVRFTNTSGFTGSLVATGQTASRSWVMPNKSGTVALSPVTRAISGVYTVTSDYQIHFCDTTAAKCQPDLPASPSIGDTYWFYDQRGTFATNSLEINGNGNNINGVTPLSITTSNKHVQVIYNGSQWSAFISA